MGLIIGKAFAPHTWGGLRSIVFNGNLISTGAFGTHSAEYHQGFKTSAGNGFVRTDYSALYANAAAPLSGPNFNATGLVGPPDPKKSEFASLYSINGAGSSSGMLVNEDRLQFTGQTATLGTGTITITSAAFIEPYYQIYTEYSASETIVSISGLAAFP
jgi:hypothetical protein